MMQLEVAVAVPVKQLYTYALSDDDQALYRRSAANLVGRRVFVPFGNRRATGYVLDVNDKEKPEFEVKNVIEVLDDDPLFHADIVPLFRWISLYYHYPIGIVVKTALPAGLTIGAGRQICLTNKKCFELVVKEFSAAEIPDWATALAEKQMLSPAQSKKLLSSPHHKKLLERLVKQKCIAIEKITTRERVRKKYEVCYRTCDNATVGKTEPPGSGDKKKETRERIRTIGKQEKYNRSETKTLAYLSEIAASNQCPDVPRKELLCVYPYAAQVIGKLIEKKLIEVRRKRVYRSPFGDILPYYDQPETLTEEQRQVLLEINETQHERTFKTFLLHGITGSGKTEVYLQSAHAALQMGKTVLVLVPEIALATQIEAHFVSRFGDKVALLHSGLTPGERYDEWQRIASGEAQVVIGARSAVFAPLSDLGLIIVDEEQDSSFKQEDSLRYNARDVAIVRARYLDAVVVLGSATPSVTSFHHGSQGKYHLLKMNNRVGGRLLPTVSVVDLRKRDKDSGRGLFHKLLEDGIRENFKAKQQTILLLNRRGFSTSVICQDCGSLVECRHCNVTMNYHKKRKILLCHYCGYSLPVAIRCLSCNSATLQPIGFGTERVVEAVEALVPDARITRLDSDISSDRKNFLSILQSVRDGAIDILVGTQLIAKGLHFPNVTLVGIVLADSGLAFPDYRSAEKTYQLIAQVTGRAGRGDREGRVIIQSMHPEHYAIRLAAQHNYNELAGQEIDIRRQAGFPPFTRLASIRIEHASERKARNSAQAIASEARSWCQKNDHNPVITILGPAPAPLEKLRDFYRWHVLLKSIRLEPLHQLIDHVDTMFQPGYGERITIDIDPENML